MVIYLRTFTLISENKIIFILQSDLLRDFERYSFKANWFQKEAEMFRPFIMNVYPKDNSVEIVSPLNSFQFIRFIFACSSL